LDRTYRIALLLIVGGVVLSACSAGSAAPSTTAASGGLPLPNGNTTTNDPGEPVSIVAVVDGDTIEVDRGRGTESVRLIGINAPERDECHGDSARSGLADQLEGTAVTLEAPPGPDRDRFGRLLRYVAADGRDVNAQLLADGHAFLLQTDHPRQAEYLSTAEEAAAAGRGLWATDLCGPPRDQALAISAFEANPPGRDDDPTTGEYVVIARWEDGAEPWDLAGWMLRDESSIHRFVFPGVGIMPTQQYTVYTGCGSDRGFELFWCADGPVWSNGGDTIILLDPAGNVVTHLTYQG
jgi:endonuclease YncB( thermonuclease family)